jgi:hypothetical protein
VETSASFEARSAPPPYPAEIPDEPWRTYTGTKLETADTAKESLQLTGSPLLGRSRWQQGLVATCEDSTNEAKAEVGERHMGLAHESVGAMTEE